MASSYDPTVAQAIIVLSEAVSAALTTLEDVVEERERQVLELLVDVSDVLERELTETDDDLFDDEDELEDDLLDDATLPADADEDELQASPKLVAVSESTPQGGAAAIAALESAATRTVAEAMSNAQRAVARLDHISSLLLTDIADILVDEAEYQVVEGDLQEIEEELLAIERAVASEE